VSQVLEWSSLRRHPTIDGDVTLPTDRTCKSPTMPPSTLHIDRQLARIVGAVSIIRLSAWATARRMWPGARIITAPCDSGNNKGVVRANCLLCVTVRIPTHAHEQTTAYKWEMCTYTQRWQNSVALPKRDRHQDDVSGLAPHHQ
jgi:hypothetical protein